MITKTIQFTLIETNGHFSVHWFCVIFETASFFLGKPGIERKDLTCLSERFDSGGTKTAAFDPITVYVYPRSLPVPQS